ncbi:hypothetical protein BEH94_07475 [Candidatus Altiarchaeales archaeon WOR_SM1_SCG]|nr:hypothetical protein BEH94_07475 [Candidatus Altiarchaeales archaeon WOR_SM1_SCG]
MNHIKAVKEFGKELLERFGDKIESIILFGSAARGTADEESDIDILIVAKTSKSLKRDIENFTYDYFFKRLGILAMPIIISTQRFHDMKINEYPFIMNVLKGITIK